MRITFAARYVNETSEGITVHFPDLHPAVITGQEEIKILDIETGERRRLKQAERLQLEAAMDHFRDHLLGQALVGFIVDHE
jgi:hypothetical protein